MCISETWEFSAALLVLKVWLTFIKVTMNVPGIENHQPFTPWKFNIGPENIPSQKESSLPTIIFQGQAVKLREGTTRILSRFLNGGPLPVVSEVIEPLQGGLQLSYLPFRRTFLGVTPPKFNIAPEK